MRIFQVQNILKQIPNQDSFRPHPNRNLLSDNEIYQIDNAAQHPDSPGLICILVAEILQRRYTALTERMGARTAVDVG